MVHEETANRVKSRMPRANEGLGWGKSWGKGEGEEEAPQGGEGDQAGRVSAEADTSVQGKGSPGRERRAVLLEKEVTDAHF